MKNNDKLFEKGKNCTAVSQARFAAPIVDCANYYRALHEAISASKKNIYIVGWDIDSRIRLIRGREEKQSSLPSKIIDLIKYKTEENPELDVRLLRWDSSFAFFGMREVWAKEVWDDGTPDNVQTMLDCTIPMGGSQHQKIVIIDNELAFTGGMDVAVHRWDTRKHEINHPERDDGDGAYGPFHDVQVAVTGEVVKHLAKLVKWRWNRLVVDHDQPIKDLSFNNLDTLPETWPKSVEPIFENIDCAIAQTIPEMTDAKPRRQVKSMLLDLINQAREFVYIENQFANNTEIAKALNKRLKECPSLRVLIVSSYKPEGAVETEAYWAGRIDFKKQIEDGVKDEQVLIAYSGSTDREGLKGQKRVHAKVMVIDNNYFVIGSSNLSKRSMTLDTECDLTFAANNKKQQEKVEWFRNDLISEHSGWPAADVQKFIDGKNTFNELTSCKEKYVYCLKEAEDEVFTDKNLQNLITPIGDPIEPIIPSIPLPSGKTLHVPNPSKKSLILFSFFTIVALLVGSGYLLSQHVDWMNQDYLIEQLTGFRDSPWAIFLVCAIYMIAGLLFFPVSVLSLAVAMVFGAVWGVVYGMAGALCSTLLLFVIGQFVGEKGIRSIIGPRINRIDKKFADNGILGVAIIRNIPVAPFSLVNMVAGVSSIKLYHFLIGTFIGMLPLMIVKGIVGGSVADILREPTIKHISFLVVGVIAWLAVAYGTQKLINKIQRKANTSKKSQKIEKTLPSPLNNQKHEG